MTTEHGTQRNAFPESLSVAALFDSVPLPLHLMSADDHVTLAANPELCKLMGYTLEEFLAIDPAKMRHPDDIREAYGAREDLESGEIDEYRNHARYLKKDGSVFWGEAVGVPIGGEDGKVIALLGMLRDVTDHKLATERFERLFEFSPDALVVSDECGLISMVNARATSLFGYARTELVGTNVGTLLAERFRDDRMDFSGAAPSEPLDMFGRRRDGTEIPIEISWSPLALDTGTMVCTAIRDVSERARAEASLRARTNELAEAQRIAHIGNWMWNLGTDEVLWSDEMYRIHGLEPQSEPVTLRSALDFVHPEDIDGVDIGLRERTAEERAAGLTYRIRRRDGSERWVFATSDVRTDENGTPLQVVGVVRDVTARRRAERRIQEFVTIASHELRTPLTSVRGFAATMHDNWDRLSEDEKLTFLDIIVQQSDRLSRLVDDLLTLSKTDSGTLVGDAIPVDVREAIELAVSSQVDLDSVSINCPSGLTVTMDDDHLQQVLVNFLGNAAKYGAAPISVEVTCSTEWVTVVVADQGDGVPREFVPELFKKFTQDTARRQPHEGTGLGLSIVQGIAESYGGRTWYEDNDPHGARFCVQLPRVARGS